VIEDGAGVDAHSIVSLYMVLLVVSLPLVGAVELRLVYDANGNLVTGDGKFRVYNSLNQLSKIYNGTSASDPLLEEYTHHPLEERVLMKKVYSGGMLQETTVYISRTFVQVINSSGTYNYTYIYHEGQLVAQSVNGVKLFIHGNHEGSSSVVTNASGAVIERTEYSPFGEQLNQSGVRYGYEGKEYSGAVGDTDFNFRKYKPEWGLFTQPDDVIQNVYDPQMLNRYSFERNNPYKYVDEDGHSPAYAWGFAIGFAFGAVNYGYTHQGEGWGSIANFAGYMARGIGHGVVGGAVGVGTVAFATSGGRIAATAGGVGLLRTAGLALIGGTGYVADQAIDGQPVDYGDLAIFAAGNALPTGVSLRAGTFISSSNPFASNTLRLADDQIRGNVLTMGGQNYLAYISGGSSYSAAVTNTILDRPGVQLNRGGHSAKYEIKTSSGGRYPTSNVNWRPRLAGTPGGKGGGSSFGGR